MEVVIATIVELENKAMRVESNISLLPYNTFGVDVLCSEFYQYSSVEELEKLFQEGLFASKWLSVGGGSNLLFLQDFHGAILHSSIKEIEVTQEREQDVEVRVGAGVVWDDFVAWCVEHDLGGVENLSYIPGCVGASPVQNIGAYGVEAKDVISEVEVFDTQTGSVSTFAGSACSFAYRHSLFKTNPYYIVTYVTFRLTKSPHHKFCLSYGNLLSVIEENGVEPSLRSIREVVVNVRKSKLPEPSVLGSAGSFFKNPLISIAQFKDLKERYPNVPFFEVGEEKIKIPAGWLIEQCGWKGKRVGNVGVYDKQALVLVNYGGATGSEIESLANDICSSVHQEFGLKIEPEVCFIR